ncbi:MAG TPA: hypothetical protein VLA00_13775 [Xanthobacteraceae bacterium]|nr:hypothetical protein [Xanthobacteraceae bacterium]
MADLVLLDGDQAIFQPGFGAAIVMVQPGRIAGSGPMRAAGKRACVDGDEASVSVPGCLYMTPLHSIPGIGTLAIAALAGNQLSVTSAAGGARLMLKGGAFIAQFTVQVPAMQPPPGPGAPIPDATPSYSGAGTFVTANTTVKAG